MNKKMGRPPLYGPGEREAITITVSHKMAKKLREHQKGMGHAISEMWEAAESGEYYKRELEAVLAHNTLVTCVNCATVSFPVHLRKCPQCEGTAVLLV